MRFVTIWLALLFAQTLSFAAAQTHADPSIGATLASPPASTLREQFIWTAGDAAALDPALQSKVRGQDDKIAPHFFRAVFEVGNLPPESTLYLAGPRSATVYLNGRKVLSFADSGRNAKGFTVTAAAVAGALVRGKNLLAVEEVRGHSSLHTGADATINQLTYGEVLLLKIVPRDQGIDAAPLLTTSAAWRSTLKPAEGWEQPGFDDSAWPTVQALGVPGTKSDFLQWNADAGLYAWPGYAGIGSAMRTYPLGWKTRIDMVGDSVTFDFGQELAGRLHVRSRSDRAATIVISYGESAEEAMHQPYLGPRSLVVPAHGEAYGPKSAFRYARVGYARLSGEPDELEIEAQAIVDPVVYRGSFTSSDPLLNRIWETAAYTAHLCMQEDGIWDGPKRDRGRWMGDLDVTGRTISAVFGDTTLMEATMTQVIGETPVKRDVNTIAGYSALWITGQADFYRHLGDLRYLRSMQPRLLQLLGVMDAELSPEGLFTNPAKHKVFVDWSPDFSTDTPESRAATHLEFALAYGEAAYLLRELGDAADARLCDAKREKLEGAAQAMLVTGDTFGQRWQTNAMAVVSHTATPRQQQAIWQDVLARVADPASTDIVTPYYGFYVLSAMAQLGRRVEALDWMRRYWGGMLAEGATSFWEAYDPHWPKEDFHAHLQADGKTGYYVSLAHGWASGPAAYLAEQVLGIEPTGGGFRTVRIQPELAGLAYARGAEPTPRGLLSVEVRPARVAITLPPGTVATLSLPFAGAVIEDGRRVTATLIAGRRELTVRTPGSHVYTTGAQP